MTRRRTVVAMPLVLATYLGCEGTSAQPPGAASPPNTAASDGCGPLRDLAELDTRQPVPLQPMMAWHQKQNMMTHLLAIQHVTAGLADEDWDAVAAASALIEQSPQMQQMCEHMGAGADGFTELALDFHERANAIGEAARAQDGPRALRATATTLEACVGCHARFRQHVVDDATWQAEAGSAASHPP